jgi:phosphoribosylformylglycinamidine cyclo-ligase
MSRYEAAGVSSQDDALSAVKRHLGPTFSLPSNARILTGFGHYAAAIQIREDLALALCTDGVGSKTVIASQLDRYDTIGFDCVAMNVNDIICIGARPLAMVDYLGVHKLEPARAEKILEGLGRAAKEAGVAVPGGELAQLPDVIGSSSDPCAFDLVGTCIGTLRPSELILGDRVRPGDAVIGIASSGIHSNGLSLARRVLSEAGRTLHDDLAGSTLGDELLKPTEIYVSAICDLWDEGIDTKGLAHITGDGLNNLRRLGGSCGYRIEALLDVPPIFDLIQSEGSIDDGEMFTVFNMGIGFVVIVTPQDEARALERLARSTRTAARIGTVTDEAGVVEVEPRSLRLHS